MKKYLLAITVMSFNLAIASTAPALPPVPMPGIPAQAQTPPALSSSSASMSSSVGECKNIPAKQLSADSLFALGKWIEARTAYESICPCLPRKSRTQCLLQAIRALSQEGTGLEEALSRINSLTLTTEPEDEGFGELMLTQSTLYVQAGNAELALKSWKLARQVVLPGKDVQLKALCTQIRQLWKDTTLSTDCSKIPSLSKHLASALSTPSPKGSSSSQTLSSSPATTGAQPIKQTVGTNGTAEGSWVLQFGAFSSKENAQLLLKNLKSRKIPSRLVTKNTSTKVLWLVQTEPFQDKETASAYGKSTLEPLGLEYQALPNP